MNRNYRQRILDEFGDILHDPGSILLSDDEEDFWSLVDEVGFSAKTLIEIGTARGISTVLLAEIAEKIITFDIREYRIKYEIWEYFNVEKQITYMHPGTRLEVKEIVNPISFDAAFIDGYHNYPSVSFDIGMLKGCGKLLFHDYDWESVEQAVSELIKSDGGKITVRNKFAFWTNL